MINHSLFKKIKNSNSKILIVTKYRDSNTTNKIISEAENAYPDIIYWLWENRIDNIKSKDIVREKLHFIWSIQSKKIKDVVVHCCSIHSLDSLKHAEIINNECEKQNLKINVFIQINLDPSKESWISPAFLRDFLNEMKKYNSIEVVWISWMWKREFTIEEKRKEFQILLDLKQKYIPTKAISAGTSLDYEIALEMGIDVVRIGRKWVN